MMAKGSLQQWIAKVVERGDLYERENIVPQGEPNPEVQNADVGEGNQEEEANGVIDDGIVVDGEPEEAVPLSGRNRGRCLTSGSCLSPEE